MATIGDLTINLLAEIGSFRASMEEGKAQLGGLQGAAESAASSLRTLTEGAAGLVAAISVREIVDWAKSTAEAGAEIEHVAERVGLSVSAYQTFGYAAKLAGIDTDTFNRSLSILSRNIGEVAQGGGEKAAKALADLGVSIRDTHGEMLPFQDIVLSIADKLSALTDKNRANADAFALTGRNAQAASTFYKELADGGFEKVRAKAEELGIILSDQTAEAAKKTHEEFVTLSEIIQNQMINALVDAAPAIKVVTDGLIELAKDADYIIKQWSKPLVDPNALGVEMVAKQIALQQELDLLLTHPGEAMEKYNIQVGEVSNTIANLQAQIAANQKSMAELPGDRSTGSGDKPKAGPPVVDPEVAKQAADFKKSYDELLTSFTEGKAAQDSLRAAYQQGAQAVEEARVRTAGLAAVQKAENEAVKDHQQIAAQELQIIQGVAEAKERSTIATERQKAATDGMAASAKQEYDALLKLGEPTDGLTKKEVELADATAKVWEAYNLGIIKTLPEAESKIKDLQTAFNSTSKDTTEIVNAVSRGASQFLDSITKLGQSSEPLKQQFANVFLGLANDIEKAIVQALILKPLMDSLKTSITSAGGGAGGLGGLLGGAGGWLGGLFGGGSSAAAAAAAPDASNVAVDAGMWGFANGGSFDVGGSGGTDSQVVGFKATPGEHVSVGQTGNTTSGMNVVINNNHSGANVSAQQVDDGNGGKNLMVQIDETLAYATGVGKSQLATTLINSGIGNARTPIAR